MGFVGFITHFIFTAALTISFLLMGLASWHAYLISRGMTSIERLLHQDYIKESTQRDGVFINPYNFGLVENWKRFFNVYSVGEFLQRVLLPSTHQPRGNGIAWETSNVYLNLQSTRPVAVPPEPEPVDIPSDLESKIPSTETRDLKKDQ